MGGSPNDIRISDMRPTLVEPPMYKPKVVLLGKEKKVGEMKKPVEVRVGPIFQMHVINLIVVQNIIT